jgi:hypothetical protein
MRRSPTLGGTTFFSAFPAIGRIELPKKKKGVIFGQKAPVLGCISHVRVAMRPLFKRLLRFLESWGRN